MINLQNSDTQKIQLTIVFDIISSKDTNKEQTMHSKSDNVEVMTLIIQMKLLKNFFICFFLEIKSFRNTNERQWLC